MSSKMGVGRAGLTPRRKEPVVGAKRPASRSSRPAVSAPITATDLLSKVLDAEFAGGAHLAYSDRELRRFNHTHWMKLSEEELGGLILQHLPVGPTKGAARSRATVREVVGLLKMHRATGADRSRLQEPLPIINVRNGELWINEDGSITLKPHDPASDQDYRLEVDYDPAAACPHYDRALSEIFLRSTSPAAIITIWHEFTGYLLQPARPEARIFVGRGAGNDGKTALATFLARMLGKDRIAAMPVGKLANSPFMLGHLASKRLFLDDDVAVGTVLPDGLLKTISEAKVVTGESKYREPFEFENRAVPLLLCNAVPELRDISHGFHRRLVVIPFDRRFSPAEVDKTLFSRIAATEMPGVLNRALEGLQRVIQRGWKFDPPAAVIEATDAWWAEATGASSGIREPPQGSVNRAKRSLPTPRSNPVMTTERGVTREAVSAATEARARFSVNVELSQSGKSCTVRANADAATVDICVTFEADRDAPLTIDQAGDGR